MTPGQEIVILWAMKAQRIIFSLLLTLAGVACGGGGDSTDTPPNTDTGNAVDTTTAPPECNLNPMGVFTTSVADIIYQNKTVTGSGTHVSGDGCLNTANLVFDINGGCKLSLDFSTQGGQWALTAATFDADANCGEAFPDSAYGAYQADMAASKASLVDLPAAVDNADAANSCLTGDNLTMAGRLQLTGPDTLTGWLTNLSLKGALSSAAASEGSCPETPAFCAADEECGEDAYGVSCGECAEGFQCTADSVCVVNYCPTTAPPAFGVNEGNTAEQIILKDCDGNEFKFEDNMCNNNATFINLFAPW